MISGMNVKMEHSSVDVAVSEEEEEEEEAENTDRSVGFDMKWRLKKIILWRKVATVLLIC